MAQKWPKKTQKWPKIAKMAQKWPKMAQKLAPAKKIAEIYLQYLQLFASLVLVLLTFLLFVCIISLSGIFPPPVWTASPQFTTKSHLIDVLLSPKLNRTSKFQMPPDKTVDKTRWRYVSNTFLSLFDQYESSRKMFWGLETIFVAKVDPNAVQTLLSPRWLVNFWHCNPTLIM